ncbi:MAG TPA: PspA/IM30 family protein [Vicinamibacteria bacterium]|jgi:phage shock protein A|nr:PspA/IM30 family protein [Vicinamibacteria bacterium]HXB53577.1 PspA/IM30 family protein [Vicinamibacteria bacterium]
MFTRIGRFFKAIFNAILGEAEAQVPLSMLEQSVREMLDNLRSLREATATTIAFETKAKRDLDAQNARVRNLDKQAEEGLRQGNEKLARRALQLQVEAKGTRERADQTYKASKLRADNARAKLTVEEERVQGKIRQLGELKAIHQMNEAQRRMQAITDEYNIDGAVNVFDKTAGSIQEQADKLSAMDTIAVSEGEDLDRQLAAISQKTEVDAALEALKSRLAEAPTPSAAPAKERQKISSAFDEK